MIEIEKQATEASKAVTPRISLFFLFESENEEEPPKRNSSISIRSSIPYPSKHNLQIIMSSIATSFFDPLLSPFSTATDEGWKDNTILWMVLLLTIVIDSSRSVICTVFDSLVSSESARSDFKMTLKTIWFLVFCSCLSQVLVSAWGGDTLSTQDWMFGLVIGLVFRLAFEVEYISLALTLQLYKGKHLGNGYNLGAIGTSVIASIAYSFTKKRFCPNATYLFDIVAIAVGVILATKGASLLLFRLTEKPEENMQERRQEEPEENLQERHQEEQAPRQPEQALRQAAEQHHERNSKEEENAPDIIPMDFVQFLAAMTGSNVIVTSTGSFPYDSEEEEEEEEEENTKND